MPAYRFFTSSPLQPKQPIAIDEEESHHIRVMRLKDGDPVEVIDGMGRCACGPLLTKGKRHFLYAEDVVFNPPAPPFTIYQAICQMHHLEWVAEKGVELGMTQLLIFAAEHSPKTLLAPSQLKRLKTLSIAALKQSGHLYLPCIEMISPLLEWKNLPPHLFFGDFDASYAAISAWKECAGFITGPERGLTNEERVHLRHLHAQGVCLHRNTLRTETASICALTYHFFAREHSAP